MRADPPAGLREAVQSGDRAKTVRLIDGLPDKERAGASADALTWSAYYGQADVLTDLLKRGVPADPTDGRSWTPLLAAVKGDQPDSVSILLARGAKPDAHPGGHRSSAAELAIEPAAPRSSNTWGVIPAQLPARCRHSPRRRPRQCLSPPRAPTHR